jgi:hypothetical protein
MEQALAAAPREDNAAPIARPLPQAVANRGSRRLCRRRSHNTTATNHERAMLIGGIFMIRRLLLALACACVLGAVSTATEAQAQNPNTRAYGRVWGGQHSRMDWERFYHYPYVYYPQNFYGSEYYRSSEDLYFRYPQEMRIPTYNRQWHNEYPQERRYHQGHQFILDVF